MKRAFVVFFLIFILAGCATVREPTKYQSQKELLEATSHFIALNSYPVQTLSPGIFLLVLDNPKTPSYCDAVVLFNMSGEIIEFWELRDGKFYMLYEKKGRSNLEKTGTQYYLYFCPSCGLLRVGFSEEIQFCPDCDLPMLSLYNSEVFSRGQA